MGTSIEPRADIANACAPPDYVPVMLLAREHWRPWVLGAGVWTGLAVLSTVQAALRFAWDGRPVPWTPLSIDRFSDWYSCALFTPLFFWLVRRYPSDRARWWRPLGVLALVIAVVVPLKTLLYAGALHTLIPGFRTLNLNVMVVGGFIPEFMAFGAMVGVIYAVEFHRRSVAKAAEAANLEMRLTRARLETLTAQLQPHFLFNTLHAVSTLMHRDVEAADAMVARLGELLRHTLDDDAGVEVPLAREVELLGRYLDIARVRFQDRLTVDLQISADTTSAMVPRFVLQPLVENALQHGISSRPGPGRVTVAAHREGNRLSLMVSDSGDASQWNGNGFPREGIGLSNTRLRLQERYGRDHTLQMEKSPDGGLVVRMSIPYRSAHA